MLFLNFRKWSSKHGRIFSYWRYYKHGYKWTPLIKVTFRHLKTQEPCDCHVCRSGIQKFR